MRVEIQGGGPAGAAAAIAARLEGVDVRLNETRRMPRHKVCGEFLSPEIAPVLERLGVWREFLAARPARIERVSLQFGGRSIQSVLPEPAYGMSRFRFDELLFRRACSLAATNGEEAAENTAKVLASGRAALTAPPRRGRRLFGFKAHFYGPAINSVELFFFSRCYVGLNSVEGGITNVCGLAPEDLLARRGFDYDALIDSFDPLRERLRPLTRAMDWLSTGPLVFGSRFSGFRGAELVYPAGDALLFVDPFTGSGLLNAVSSGRLAGIAAARGTAPTAYLQQCRKMFSRPFVIAAVCRAALATHCAEFLAPLIPARLLFVLTRTHA